MISLISSALAAPEAIAAAPATTSLSESVIYLMGLSFVLGSFFTILVLILLDVMRRRRGATSVNAE